MAEINTPLTFTVRRRAPELIVPANPTPRELKPLSNIDDQERLRLQIPGIFVYRRDPKMRDKNPEGAERKLMVDCSGQGVLFIEAEADVTLDQFGDALRPPFPCMEELLYEVPGSSSILHTPLLLIQVTRLLCEGFIFAIRFNHTMCDGLGLRQFLSGLGEIARGATSPSTLPVWERELFCSSDQPRGEKYQVPHTNGTPDDMVHKSLFFTTTDISAFRRLIPIDIQRCSTFEVLSACLWRCRTIALQPDPKEDMPFLWPVNVRKIFNPPVPVGYYGNVMAFAAAISTAGDLCNKPLGYALELMMKVKSDVTKGHIRSISDLMAFKGRLYFTDINAYTVSDLTSARFDEVDIGWGKAAYGGAAKGRPGMSYLVPYTNNKGEPGIAIPVCLPSGVMERFVKELNNMLGKSGHDVLEHELPVLSKL
ncbi:putative benzyl alcohol O-benzoyltransferase [Helianthus annuus]|nr:putative benzyl alcohol O-benzoyltransferase [Helianthus annuus]KAJ0687128.1 putative benzyl alcohol O-benzoyltransferase [Helianthus annuus]KAJ0872594.1 putative benzyl alcohol O-benzoyltransferase [Helianthus annuus]